MTESSFNERLIKAMAAMENPRKSKTADTGKYMYQYETLEQVLSVVRPALAEQGIGLTQGIYSTVEGFVLKTNVFDSNGEGKTLDVRPMPEFRDAQAAGSWETYMRRYALRSVFGLTGEDDDGAATKKPRLATKDQMDGLMLLVGRMGELHGKGNDEVIEALMKAKTMAGANFDRLTEEQAARAINQLNAWIAKEDQQLSEKDIDF